VAINIKNLNIYDKDPSEVLDYTVDFRALTNLNDPAATEDYLAAGETISTKTVTVVNSSNITVDSDVLADTASSVVITLSGGTAGEQYQIQCLVTTTASRTAVRSFIINCVNR